MSEQNQKSMLGWLVLSVVIVIADLVTKYYATSLLEYAMPVEVIPANFLTLLCCITPVRRLAF